MIPRLPFLRATLLSVLGLSVAAIHATAGASEPKFAGRIASLAAARPQQSVVAWIYFTDRAGAEHRIASLAAERPLVSARALERRARRGTLNGLDAGDLPVNDTYLRAITARGARLRGASRWLNAASVEMPAGLAAELSLLPFVARIELVPTGTRMSPVGEAEPAGDAPGEPVKRPMPRLDAQPDRILLAPGDTAYYGGAFRQLGMMQVPQLHALGLSGAGVLVCILDTGFRTTHRAYAELDVVARRDFVNGDENVDVEPGQDSANEASHGTYTLGCIAGSRPGTYSGGAFGASVALGKTEYISTEQPIEMDYWQFGAEWADSLGADVLSSSLGYFTFDSPFPSYGFGDMDGRTTIVTRAAVEAMRRGITVVNSAGNEGGTPWQKIIGPADADTVIAAGAVDSFSVVTSFSSRGPTADGRIKPDITAMGSRVLVPSFSNDSTYSRVSGTSFSCPLTAGLAALLLEAHPGWRPVDVRDALRETALNHAAPDTVIGWGLVQGMAARNWVPPTADVSPAPRASQLALAAGPNPLRAGQSLTIRFSAPAGEDIALEVLDLGGRRVASLYHGGADGAREARWSGADDRGRALAAGVYFVRLVSLREVVALRTVLLP